MNIYLFNRFFFQQSTDQKLYILNLQVSNLRAKQAIYNRGKDHGKLINSVKEM